ncbi:MAG: SpaA isopeptide-forming pilin-related protein [Anaerovoracaceae bacterium]|jgi:hypothetical protein
MKHKMKKILPLLVAVLLLAGSLTVPSFADLGSTDGTSSSSAAVTETDESSGDSTAAETDGTSSGDSTATETDGTTSGDSTATETDGTTPDDSTATETDKSDSTDSAATDSDKTAAETGDESAANETAEDNAITSDEDADSSAKTGEDESGAKPFSVESVWNDDSYENRPESVKVIITKEDGSIVDTATLTSGNKWTYKWYGSSSDTTDTYQVEEAVPDGYSAEITASDSESGGVYTITNTLNKSETEDNTSKNVKAAKVRAYSDKNITIQKVIDPESVSSHPDSVEITITPAVTADSTPAATVAAKSIVSENQETITLTAEGGWKKTLNHAGNLDYYITEKKVPGFKATYTRSGSVLTAKNNKVPDATFTVNKTDKNGKNPLEGAVFTIYSDSGSVAEATTNAEGKATLDITADMCASLLQENESTSLYLKETQAPTGYKANTTNVYTLNLTAKYSDDNSETPSAYSLTCGGASEITVSNERNETNDYSYGRFTVNKTDENGTKLDDATFTIYEDEKCKTPVTTVDGNKSVNLSSSAFSNYLSSGKDTTLYLKETKAPAGYTADTTVYPLTLSSGESSGWNSDHSAYVTTTSYTLTYKGSSSITVANERNNRNEYKYNEFTVNKTDESGSELDGAVFTIYADKNCANAITTVNGNEEIDLSAKAFEEYLPDAGEDSMLYLKETTPPNGYIKDNDVYTLKLTAEASSDWNSGHSAYVTATTYDLTYNGDSEITVVNERNESTAGSHSQFTVNKTDGSGNKLDGAVFTIYADENCATAVTTVNGNETFDLSASAFKDYLPDAGENTTLYLKETTAPDGYNADTAVYPLTLSSEETSDWNSGHTVYVTTTAYSMTYNGEQEITVVNEKITSGEKAQGNTSDFQQGSSQQTASSSSSSSISSSGSGSGSGSDPATEDQTNMLLWIIIIIIAAAVIIVLLVIRHRRR